MKKVQTHLFLGIFTYIILTLFRGIFLTRWHRRELALLLFLTLDLNNVLWPSFNHQDCPYLTQLPYGLFLTPWTCPDVISVNKDGPREAQPNVPSKTQVAGVERCHTWNNPFALSLWLSLKHPFLQCRTENTRTASETLAFCTMNIPFSYCNGFALLSSQPAECVKQGPLNEEARTVRDVDASSLKSGAIFGSRLPPFFGDSREVKVTFKFDILRMELCRWFENLPSDFTLVCVAKPKPRWNSFGLFVRNTDAIIVFQTFLCRKLSPVKKTKLRLLNQQSVESDCDQQKCLLR